MAVDIGPRIGIDGEKEFRNALNGINQQLKTLGTEMKAVTSAFDANDKSQENLAQQSKVLAKEMQLQEQRLQEIQKALDHAKSNYAENSTEVQRWQQVLNKATAELNQTRAQFQRVSSALGETENEYDRLSRTIKEQETRMRELRQAHANAVLTSGKSSSAARSLYKEIADLNDELQKNRTAMRNAEAETRDYADALNDADSAAGGLGSLFGGSGLGGLIGKGLGVGAVVGGITAITGAISGLVDETQEYRRVMGALEASSAAAGYSAEQTSATYEQLYRVLGDNQTAATATANLQAVGLAQEDLYNMTELVIGAWARYGDSIPIDGLAESVNETIRAGQVTGTFADVLNWGAMEGETFGVKMRESTEANKEWNEAVEACETAEDYFNLALQDCGTQAERADLVMQAMADQGLAQVAEGYHEVNSATEDANTAQAEYEEAQANLAEKLLPVKTALTELASGGFDILSSAIDSTKDAIKDLGDWWDRTQPKLEDAWDKFWGIEEGQRYGRLPDGSYGYRTIDGSHAMGLDYVPWDGYIAQLHRGEMILPESEARTLREAMAGAMTPDTGIRDTIESAAAGTVNGLAAVMGSQRIVVEVPLSINGQEFVRAILTDLRAVQKANPEVAKA